MERVAYNRTKIVATVGPASNSKEMLTALVKAGVDVFRINFSHGTHADHQPVIDLIREINAEWGTHVAILMDLQGPKIRVNTMEDNVVLKKGQELVITTRELTGNGKVVSTSYKNLPQDVKVGEKVLIDDGKIELKVTEVRDADIVTKVVYGGPLTSRKGINLPHTKVSAPSLTDKDVKDLAFGLKNNVNWVALSFVRKAQDIIALREILKKNNSTARIVAKIEKPEALNDIDAIMEATDAVMVARGDLGVEIWMEEVPVVQKQLIEKCNKASKPVIVATQMMESMIENPRPTRAETNDVANAVMDGADALMLSAETATGKYPLEVVRSMVRTITSIEKQPGIYYKFRAVDPKSPIFIHDSLILAACKLAQEVGAKAIVGMTTSGYTAFESSSHRPNTNIFVFTGNKSILETMNLVWGTRAYYYDKQTSTDETIADIAEILKADGHVKKGDIFISLASMPIHEKSRTNMMKINVVN
ncbi:MAG: pyruvate kinase [Cyclobacteriaceae bacterium]|nr:pyruvate kinase [Cyclobacteriaceae bacterium]MCB9238744.1 pyruvate kinase [Flammeovirgaceae bacterium]MCB0498020.1 pyruvate kinase [Cyclobacteriaceae bacterium]MCO5270462.1 pyruvate kinase [Cyclobacteriaceae bacterium]MCW5901096.1 pyruvate kinase [Cyclobacteriaceae bacterium]